MACGTRGKTVYEIFARRSRSRTGGAMAGGHRMTDTPFRERTARTLLRDARRIAIVGAKDKAGQPVDRIGRYLLAHGFTVLPVHPVRRQVWGLPTFRTLADLPGPVDIINLFRASEACLEHAQETLALPWRPRCFWMQEGIRNEAARRLLEPEGILVVEDACIMVEHQLINSPLQPLL